jgi:hypothetical protein
VIQAVISAIAPAEGGAPDGLLHRTRGRRGRRFDLPIWPGADARTGAEVGYDFIDLEAS